MDGERVRLNPAGGTEAAVVHTAEALAGLGPDVDVWANCPADLYFEGVRYRPNQNAAEALARESYDAFVVVRHLVGATLPVRARLVAHWTNDGLAQPFPHGLVRWHDRTSDELVGALHVGEALRAGLIDLVFAVSQWQAGEHKAHFAIPDDVLHVIGNGLSREAQATLGVREHKRPFVLHTLPPDRALPELIALFPAVRERVPKAELHAYSRSTLHGVDEAEDWANYGQLYESLRALPGAKHFDPVEPRALHAALRRAKVWVDPTTVEETFSISTLEAQAAGCVPVVSAIGALPERIEHGVDGFLVPGDPAEEVVRAEFVDYVTNLLSDDELHATMSNAARERALAPSSSYAAVAARMLSALESATEGRDFATRGLDAARLDFPLPAHRQDGTPHGTLERAEFERLVALTRRHLALEP
ncbi:MAG: glycosyltransferase family 4 protein [Planctomycetota bacterium]